MSFVALGTWYGLSAGWIAAVRYLLFVVVVVVLLLAVRLFYKRSEQQQQQSSCPIILCNNVEPHLLKELLFPPMLCRSTTMCNVYVHCTTIIMV